MPNCISNYDCLWLPEGQGFSPGVLVERPEDWGLGSASSRFYTDEVPERFKNDFRG